MKRKIIIILTAFLTGTAVFCQASPFSKLRTYLSGGARYINVKDLASYYSYSVSIPPGRFVYLRNKWSTVIFENDSRQCRINNTAVWMHEPLQKKAKGRWAVAESDAEKVIDPILRPQQYLSARRYGTIVLDPGHGGLDMGARGRRSIQEKQAVLDIAKRVRLRLANEGLKVYMTRETDRFIELEDRCRKAAQWGANIFVSIHLNSAQTSRARGVETYVLATPGLPSTAAAAFSRVSKTLYSGNNYDSSNTILGYYLQKALVQKTGSEDRGLRRARFMVLKNAPCTAALVECGFVSNTYEESRLTDEKYRDTVAQGVAKGILDYIAAVKKARVAKS